jgi:hypothetical protein
MGNVSTRLPQFTTVPWTLIGAAGVFGPNVTSPGAPLNPQFRAEAEGPTLRFSGALSITGTIATNGLLFVLVGLNVQSPPRSQTVFTEGTLVTSGPTPTYTVIPLTLSETTADIHGQEVLAVQCTTTQALSSGQLVYLSGDVPLTNNYLTLGGS